MLEEIINPRTGRRVGSFAKIGYEPDDAVARRHEETARQVREWNMRAMQPQQSLSSAELLRRQYNSVPMTAADYRAEQEGRAPVGVKREITSDPQWLRLYQENPDKANEIYYQAYRVTPEQDRMASELGINQLAALRAIQRKPQEIKQYKDYLTGFEAHTGIDPMLVAEDVRIIGKGSRRDGDADVTYDIKSGYDPATETLFIPGQMGRDMLGNQVELPSRQVKIPAAARQAAMQWLSRIYGINNSPITGGAAKVSDADELAELESLEAEAANEREMQRKAAAARHRELMQSDPAYKSRFTKERQDEHERLLKNIQRDEAGRRLGDLPSFPVWGYYF